MNLTWANRSYIDVAMPRAFYDDPYGYIIRMERERCKREREALLARVTRIEEYRRETAKYGVRVTPDADAYLSRLTRP